MMPWRSESSVGWWQRDSEIEGAESSSHFVDWQTGNVDFKAKKSFMMLLILLQLCTLTGNPARAAEPTRTGPPTRVQPILVPLLTIEEIRDCTDNFGPKALIGEGSYGRVYYATLQDRVAAIKKLDASAQPEAEFLSQAWLSTLIQIVFCFCCASASDINWKVASYSSILPHNCNL